MSFISNARSAPDRAGWTAAAGLAAGAVATLLLYVDTSGSAKLGAAALGGLLLLVAAYLSGNIRLFCLWGLTLTIPFDLSKRFGPIFLKMGGESSFRAEVSDVFILALGAFLLRDMWLGRIRGLRIPKVTGIWILLILIGSYWALFGEWRTTAAHEVIRMVKVMILFVVVTTELRRPQQIYQCVAGLTFGMLVQAAFGLTEYFMHRNFGLTMLGETGAVAVRILESSTIEGQRVFRVGAFLSHPNVFGIFLAVLLPLALGAFLLRTRLHYKLFFLASAVLGMAALIVTLSRSGWASFAASFAVLLICMFLHSGLRQRSVFAATCASIAVLAVALAFAEPIMSRLFSSHEAAMLGRAEYKRDAWAMIQRKPVFGWGLNSYVLAVPPFTQYGPAGAILHYQGWIPPVHNIYYLWWAELGIIGLALHLSFWAWIIRTAIGNLRIRDKLLFTINAGCLASMAAFVVDGFFSFSLRFNSILRVYWVIAAMIYAIHYLRLRQAAMARLHVTALPELAGVSESGKEGLTWTLPAQP